MLHSHADICTNMNMRAFACVFRRMQAQYRYRGCGDGGGGVVGDGGDGGYGGGGGGGDDSGGGGDGGMTR